MSRFKELYEGDLSRYTNMNLDRWTRKYLYFFRKAGFSTSFLIKYYYRYKLRKISRKNGIEISRRTKIGKGLFICHPFNITINMEATLGDNINITKGVTIGRENRGGRKGCPTIGNKVWIGVNSTIVGKITVGDDVLIAPNTYVNCDVPSHSIVLGNPCRIIPRDDATVGYVNNPV